MGDIKRTLSLAVFAVGSVVLTWAIGFLVYLLQPRLEQMAGLLYELVLIVPFLLAYLAHNLSGSVGNPFRGLSWGSGVWYLGVWVIALVIALVIVVICLGLGLQQWDPSMQAFTKVQLEQANLSLEDIPAEQRGAMRIGGYILLFGAPTFGVLFGAAFACLSTFPWYGWFFRRMLVFGRPAAILLVMLSLGIAGMAGGLLETPQMKDTAVILRVLIFGAYTICTIPASIWLFLRTRSAVLPAFAQAAFSGGLIGLTPVLSSGQPWLVAPFGLAVVLVALAAGVALWLWQDPGGFDLAIAGSASDGKLLSSENDSPMRVN